jgi:hypothetical protein
LHALISAYQGLRAKIWWCGQHLWLSTNKVGILKLPIFGKWHRTKYYMCQNIMDNTLLSPLYFMKLFLA